MHLVTVVMFPVVDRENQAHHRHHHRTQNAGSNSNRHSGNIDGQEVQRLSGYELRE